MAPTRRLFTTPCLTVCVLLAVASSCKRRKVDEKVVLDPPYETKDSKTWRAPTAEATDAFIAELLGAVKSGDKGSVAKVIDFEAVFERAIAGIDAPADFVRGMRDGIKGGDLRLAASLIDAAVDGSMTHLRTEQREKESRPPKVASPNWPTILRCLWW